MTKSKHVCKKWFTHRGQRRCNFCNKLEWKVSRLGSQEGMVKYVWEPEMHLHRFADKWLPAVSGTNPKDMMRIDVAFPFEWNCYESWNVVWRVTFDFSLVSSHTPFNTTRTGIMDGWTSGYEECFNRIDAAAEKYYAEQTGAAYQIGDNTYEEMRRFIQA